MNTNSTYLPEDVNEVVPGSPGGPVEAVKRGVVQAFRTTLNGSSFGSAAEGEIHVEMEYPLEKTHYPSLWVQFSLSDLAPGGMGMGQRETATGNLMQTMIYRGRVTLTLLALSSRERDRMADLIINALSFSRISNPNIITENGYEETFTPLYQEFDKNPYVSITINSDKPNPMGQSISVGTPWAPDTLVYEDAYSFEVIGQFMLITENDGLYRLRRIDIDYEVAPAGTRGDDGEGTWV